MGLLGSSLDGNLLGGLLQGAGMALSGACAGTVFAQNGAGIRSSFYALGGAMVGGIVWTGFLRPALQRRRRRKPQPPTSPTKLAVDRQLGLGRTTALLLLETVFVAVIGVAASSSSTMSRTQGPVDPVTGGLLIGLAQLFSILLRKTMLGTSTAFEEFGDYFWWLAGGGARATRPSFKNMLFDASLALGSYLVSLRSPTLNTIRSGVDVVSSPARVALGGALIAVGSRMAGGCTSGHGISGISLMSVSSFVTVAAMFAGGIGVTSALG